MFDADDELTLDECASAVTFYTCALKTAKCVGTRGSNVVHNTYPLNLNGGQPDYLA